MNKEFPRQSGMALLTVLLAIGILGAASGVMATYYVSFLRESRGTFVRSAYSSLETTIRHQSSQPYAYNCDSSMPLSACTVNTAYFTQLSQVPTPASQCPSNIPCFANVSQFLLPGTKCAAGVTQCGFTFTVDDKLVTAKSSAGKTYAFLHASLSYDGTDFRLPSVSFPSVDPATLSGSALDDLIQREAIQTDILQSQAFDCSNNPATPVFVGFRADGRPDCRGFNTCPAGTYAGKVDFGSLTIGCLPLDTPDKNPDCGSSFSGVAQASIVANTWSTDGTMGHACAQVPQAPLNATTGGPTTTPSSCPSGQTLQADGTCAPTPTCPDTYYTDAQQVSSHRQDGFVTLTLNFQSAIDKIDPKCKMSDVTLNIWFFGAYAGRCFNLAPLTVTPGVPAIYGFAGHKTSQLTAVVNGGQAYMTDRTAGYGDCGGNQCAACLSDVGVVVHSVPK